MTDRSFVRREFHLTVPRTARGYLLGTPSASVRDLWIVCHGHGQLAAPFLDAFQSLADDTRLIVAPEALSRFYLESAGRHTKESPVGATWMTREDRDVEIQDIISYLDLVYADILRQLAPFGITASTLRVGALGFSQGGAAACRWTARGSTPVQRLIVWGSGVPVDVDLSAVAAQRSPFRVDLVHGTRDRFVSNADLASYVEAMQHAGVPIELHTFEGGHVLHEGLLRRLLTF